MRNPRRSPTIRDVAREAGVSPSTVSRVLTGARPVAGDLAESVRAAIERLGYQPSAAARSLRTGRTNTLGLLLPDLSYPFFTNVALGVEQAAQDRGYLTILGNILEQAEREAHYLTVLRDRWVDGLIASTMVIDAGDSDTSPGQRSSAVRWDQVTTIPYVQLDRIDPSLPADSVAIDHRAAAREVMTYLFSLGHRRIAMLAGPATVWPFLERLAGYRAALEAVGIPSDPDLIHQVPGFDSPLPDDAAYPSLLTLPPRESSYGYYVRYGAMAARDLLIRPERPTAIFAGNDAVGIGAVRVAEAMGLSVPRDLSVVGFDGLDVATFFSPPLTTVVQPAQALGAAAVELLLDDAKPSADGAPIHRVLTARLEVRSSTGPVPLPDSTSRRRRRTAVVMTSVITPTDETSTTPTITPTGAGSDV